MEVSVSGCSRGVLSGSNGLARPSRGLRRTPLRAAQRVLRYPNGVERTLYYPDTGTDEEDADSAAASYESWEWEALELDARGRWVELLDGKQKKRSARRARGGRAPKSTPEPESPRYAWETSDLWGPSETDVAAEASAPSADMIPDSPAALARYFSSGEYAAQRESLAKQVADSYEVLESCPWAVPRDLYVLSTQPREDDEEGHGSTYYLRTKISDTKATGDLSQLFGKDKDWISVDKVVDGAVAFYTPEAAGQYADKLEAQTGQQMMVAQVDSHQLFRMVWHVKACVVLVKALGAADEFMPPPNQLAASVRGRTVFEDM